MKKVIFLIFLITRPAGAQELLFHSPLTQTSPEIFPSHFEEIERILFFEGHSITITTVTSEAKDFESFNIPEISSLEQGLVFFSSRGIRRRLRSLFHTRKK